MLPVEIARNLRAYIDGGFTLSHVVSSAFSALTDEFDQEICLTGGTCDTHRYPGSHVARLLQRRSCWLIEVNQLRRVLCALATDLSSH